jgi:hypothetical protein
MKRREDTIKIVTLCAGQPRAYADHEYRALISGTTPDYTNHMEPKPKRFTEHEAKELARLFVCSFKDEPPDWAAPQFKHAIPKKPLDEHGRSEEWEVLVVAAFTD